MTLSPDTPEDPPPHLVGTGVARPIAGGVIHVWTDRCLAGMVVNVDSDDPLSDQFTVDAVIFQPPMKTRDKWTKADTRPGSVRWANNMAHADRSEEQRLSWHYVTEACLPSVVIDALAEQRGGQQ